MSRNEKSSENEIVEVCNEIFDALKETRVLLLISKNFLT
jgi:hypothetical protein